MSGIEPAAARGLLSRIFVSPSEPRLRAGWRLLLQVVLQVVLTFVGGSALVLISTILLRGIPDFGSAAGLLLAEIADLGAVTLSVFMARRFLDRRSFSSLGVRLDRHTAADLAMGIGITLVLMGVIFLAERALGWLTFGGFAWSVAPARDVASGVMLFVAIFVITGWNEELMSRGYHLQTMASGLTLLWGFVLSSAVFGALHLANPHATWISAAGIFLAGLFLGYAYLRTGQLWLSIGLHIGWNFFEGVVFGFPVSGLNTFHLARINVTGPEVWTGGAFGPEAGLIIVPATLIGAALIHVYTRKRSHIQTSDPGRSL